MIIFREKIFRRDEPSVEDIDSLKDNPELVKIYGPAKINIEPDSKYEKDTLRLGIKGSPDRKKLEELKDDVKRGWLITDGPHGGDTHYLGDYSKPGVFYTFSKKISEEHRFNYRVYPPKEYIRNGKKVYLKRVILLFCYDHELPEGNYLEDKNLRARKDRMRRNAPYRNKTSILSKKKHGNNRTNTKRT